MGLFRPAKTVASPSGDYWELYVSKTALPGWRSSDAGDTGIGQAGALPQLALLELPLALVSFLWSGVLVPLVRMIVLLPVAVVRGRRSHAVRIEAITTFPERKALLWTTTDAHAPRVLDEIVAGLAQGKVVQPEGAVYSGTE